MIVPEGKILVTTCDNEVHVIPNTTDVSGLDGCNHEEADSRLILHAVHALQNGMENIIIKATDTDVVVLAVYTSSKYRNMKLWVEFGLGQNKRFINVRGIADSLGSAKCSGLLFMHAVSGCDVVSQPYGIGKKTAWEIYRAMPSIITTFADLTNAPARVTDEHMAEIERYKLQENITLIICQ